MNGAIADPWLKIINAAKYVRTKIIGNNQNFFLTLGNKKNF